MPIRDDNKVRYRVIYKQRGNGEWVVWKDDLKTEKEAEAVKQQVARIFATENKIVKYWRAK